MDSSAVSTGQRAPLFLIVGYKSIFSKKKPPRSLADGYFFCSVCLSLMGEKEIVL